MAAVDDDTVSITGADFAPLEIDLARSGGIITHAEGSSATLSYSDDRLDFTEGAVTFSGQRSGAGADPTDPTGPNPTGTDDPTDTNPTDPPADACTVVIPSDVVVVRSGSDQAADNLDAWVCNGGGLNGAGDNMNVYAEAGSNVNVSGTNIALWARSGAIATVSGGNTTVYAEGGATVVASGANNERNDCDEIVFDASAVADGC